MPSRRCLSWPTKRSKQSPAYETAYSKTQEDKNRYCTSYSDHPAGLSAPSRKPNWIRASVVNSFPTTIVAQTAAPIATSDGAVQPLSNEIGLITKASGTDAMQYALRVSYVGGSAPYCFMEAAWRTCSRVLNDVSNTRILRRAQSSSAGHTARHSSLLRGLTETWQNNPKPLLPPNPQTSTVHDVFK